MGFTIEELRNALEYIWKELNNDEVEKNGWYGGLFPSIKSGDATELTDYKNSTYATIFDHPQDKKRYSFEHVLAIEAINYPELHELMSKIVAKITEYNELGNFEQIWENDKVQAGGAFARELALYSKDYIPLYYRYIKTNDLDHEVYQLDDILTILAKWDYSIETMPLLFYRQDNGQFKGIYGDNICKTTEEADEYLNAVSNYFNEEWAFDPEGESDIKETMKWLSPIFSKVLNLDENQMIKFTAEFVKQMASNKVPTIDDLLSAAKS